MIAPLAACIKQLAEPAEEARQGQGRPAAVRPEEALRRPCVRRDALPRVAGCVWAGRAGRVDPTAARVDDARVRAVLTERGLIKNKRAMPFVQLFKVCLQRFYLSILRFVSDWFVETHRRIWGRDGVQADFTVRRDGCAAGGVTLSEAHVDPRRCGGLVCRGGAGARRGGQDGIQSHDNRELGTGWPSV